MKLDILRCCSMLEIFTHQVIQEYLVSRNLILKIRNSVNFHGNGKMLVPKIIYCLSDRAVLPRSSIYLFGHPVVILRSSVHLKFFQLFPSDSGIFMSNLTVFLNSCIGTFGNLANFANALPQSLFPFCRFCFPKLPSIRLFSFDNCYLT